jgi:hydroxypyruvate isomerase
VNSPRIKVLFDIYHVQIMDGDHPAPGQDAIKTIGEGD